MKNETRFEKFPKLIAAEARKERAVSLLNSSAGRLKKIEDLLMLTRIDLVELKRTGFRQGLPELVVDVTELKSEIERLEVKQRAIDL